MDKQMRDVGRQPFGAAFMGVAYLLVLIHLAGVLIPKIEPEMRELVKNPIFVIGWFLILSVLAFLARRPWKHSG